MPCVEEMRDRTVSAPGDGWGGRGKPLHGEMLETVTGCASQQSEAASCARVNLGWWWKVAKQPAPGASDCSQTQAWRGYGPE